MKHTKHNKPIKVRNYHALNAIQRTSAGVVKNKYDRYVDECTNEEIQEALNECIKPYPWVISAKHVKE